MFIQLVPYYYVNNGASFFMLGLILPIKFSIKIIYDWDTGIPKTFHFVKIFILKSVSFVNDDTILVATLNPLKNCISLYYIYIAHNYLLTSPIQMSSM